MAGKKGRSGRRKSTSTLVMEALAENDNYLPEYLQALRSIALDDSAPRKERIDCLMYLINRSQGAPKAATDLRVKGTPELTADDMALVWLAKKRQIEALGQAEPMLLPEASEND
jgi:hypothetical protein